MGGASRGGRGAGEGGGEEEIRTLSTPSPLSTGGRFDEKKGESDKISELQAWLVLGLLVCVIASCLGQCCCRLVNTPTAKSLRWTANINNFGIRDFFRHMFGG